MTIADAGISVNDCVLCRLRDGRFYTKRVRLPRPADAASVYPVLHSHLTAYIMEIIDNVQSYANVNCDLGDITYRKFQRHRVKWRVHVSDKKKESFSAKFKILSWERTNISFVKLKSHMESLSDRSNFCVIFILDMQCRYHFYTFYRNN